MTAAEALRASGLEPREARLLLAWAGGFAQTRLAVDPEMPLPEATRRRFLESVARRRSGEPVAYIVGHKEFYGLEFAVGPTVLIPRPETELLVELALERRFERAADLGTGSGVLAVAIKKARPAARLVAVDTSPAALELATLNAARHGLEIEFRLGNWCEPLSGELYDLIVSNPPYVASGDPHLAGLRFEPQAALIAGPDGLDAIRDIARAAPAHLAHGGWLLVEHGLGQDAAVRGLLRKAGLEEVASWPDLAGIPRVTGGRRGGKG